MVKDSDITSERALVKLDRILTVAKKRFDHYGISKTTMNNIADDIGLSKASLYYYFKDKETILIAVIAREQEHFVEEMQKIIQESSTTETKLIAFSKLRTELFKSLLSPGKFNYDNYAEVKPFFTASFQKFRKKELTLLIDILKTGITQKEFSLENPKAQAEFLQETLRGLRQVVFSEHHANDKNEIPSKKYLQLEKNATLLIHYFIKGTCGSKISKK